TIVPNWWLKGGAAGLNGPLSVTTDGTNRIYVGNSGSHSVTVYLRDRITPDNHTEMPPDSVSLEFGIPSGLAVDPVARELFVADSSADRIDSVGSDPSSSGSPLILRTIQGLDADLATPVAVQYTAGKLYVLNNGTGVINVYDSKADATSTPDLVVPTKLATG